MRTRLEPSVRSWVLKIVASAGAVLMFTGDGLAGPAKTIKARASGQIVSQTPCSDTEVCQEAHVSGTATVLGSFDGVLLERVNFADGTYIGTAVFTMADGSTITTDYTGQLAPPDANGVTLFFESHHAVDGTGKYANASGTLDVTGTADAALRMEIVGVGTLIR